MALRKTRLVLCSWQNDWSEKNRYYCKGPNGRKGYRSPINPLCPFCLKGVSMQPKLTLLTDDIIERILDEAYQLLLKPGVKVNNEEAKDILASAGAQVDLETNVVKIPQQIV